MGTKPLIDHQAALAAMRPHDINRVFYVCGRYKPFFDLTEEDAELCEAIVYQDGGIDCCNDYMRDRILSNVRQRLAKMDGQP